jgi:hypothetical protein
MQMPKPVNNVMQFFSGAISRIFGLNDDNYPDTGVQPFSGDTYDDKKAHRDS